MPNRPTINFFQRVDMRTHAVDYTIDVYDDYGHTTLVFPCGHGVVSCDCNDDMVLLKAIIKAKHDNGIHGTSCDVLWAVFDYIEEYKIAICIGDKKYEWSEIEDVMRYDFRDVISCPKCGWESFSDDDYDHPCMRDGCDGIMSEIRNEEYEK